MRPRARVWWSVLALWWGALAVIGSCATAEAPVVLDERQTPVTPAAPTTGRVPTPALPAPRLPGDDDADGRIGEDESGWDCRTMGDLRCAGDPPRPGVVAL